MRLRLLIGPGRLSDPPPHDVPEEDAYLYTEEAAEHFVDLVEGARLVAGRFGFAAWNEPATELLLTYVDGPALSRLRRAAACLALHRRLPDAAVGDDVVHAAWKRGPEYYAARTIAGTARLGAYDHFLHHTGEPLVYSPADFAPVVKDNAAPGGLVPSAVRLLAEVEHLEHAMAPEGDDARALRVIAEAARTAVAAGAGLLADYA